MKNIYQLQRVKLFLSLSPDTEVSTDSLSDDDWDSDQREQMMLEHTALLYEEEELLAIGKDTYFNSPILYSNKNLI